MSSLIFCIGLNKTGTSSLHFAFKQLGISSLHWAPDDIPFDQQRVQAREIVRYFSQNIREGLPAVGNFAESYQAFSDIGVLSHYFERLDESYKDSKFIYTDRDLESWLDSREKHVK